MTEKECESPAHFCLAPFAARSERAKLLNSSRATQIAQSLTVERQEFPKFSFARGEISIVGGVRAPVTIVNFAIFTEAPC